MKIAIQGDAIRIKDADATQYQVIKSWGKVRWDRKEQALVGVADLEILDRLAGIVTLPPAAAELRVRLRRTRDAVDAERNNKNPTPLMDYPVKVRMYRHQITGANMAALTLGFTGEGVHGRGFGFLYEMGTGKTLTSIAVIGAAYLAGKIRRVLIVAPTSVCPVWPAELERFAAFPFVCRTLLGDKAKRLRQLKELEELKTQALRVAVINVESTWREGIFEALEAYDADLIICDESQRIKTHDSEQSKAMHKLGDKARYKLILSGTPVQNNAVDIFSQYRFLDSRVFGTNFYAFRNRYAIMGGFNRKQIVGYRDLDELIAKEHSIAYRVTKAEALDLPDQTFEDRLVIMDPKERGIYDRLRRDSIVELENGGTVTAATVLTRMLRLQQLTGGFLADDEGKKPQQVGTGKLDALSDIIQDYVIEGKKKLVIFARFLAEVHAIEKLADGLLKKEGMRAVTMYGEIPKEQRGEIVEQFQTDPATTLFIGQIDTAGTGITLTAADTCVYYSLSYNYATYSQSLSRIHRIGQRYPTTYIHLVAAKTVDAQILKALAKKEDLARTVVDNWRQFFEPSGD